MSPASVLSAVSGLLERSGLSMDDIGAIECNEAFAAIDVLISRAIRIRLPVTTSWAAPWPMDIPMGHPAPLSSFI